jgi:hypothetical protein
MIILEIMMMKDVAKTTWYLQLEECALSIYSGKFRTPHLFIARGVPMANSITVRKCCMYAFIALSVARKPAL